MVILMEDDPLHTDEYPFCCVDPTCGCHEDPLLIAEVAHCVDDGLLTSDEATNFVAGRLL
jgi:hypothetical protein